ncbi:MAG: Trk system potassium transporter TrkA, partial [Synergistaceae bacterium]|nr:Trk system potassium transporter TrkA [Synergistaceae bacterium]
VILQYVRYQEHALAYAMIDDINAEMLEVSLPENAPVTGRTLADIRLGKGSVVALIARGEDVIVPSGNTSLLAGDNVILFALSEMMPSTAELFGASYHGH